MTIFGLPSCSVQKSSRRDIGASTVAQICYLWLALTHRSDGCGQQGSRVLIVAYVKQRPVPMDRLARLKAKVKGKISSGVVKVDSAFCHLVSSL